MSVVSKIRAGELDCNLRQNFLSTVIKGVMYDLTRVSGIAHFMVHTGDDTMWLYERGYDASKEPVQVTNQEGIYQRLPHCVVEAGGISVMPDQLSNPYSRGEFQLEYDNRLYSLNGEFRRLPLSMELNLTYVSDSFTMTLDHLQFILTHLTYISSMYVTYMGQTIPVSYKTPDSVDKEYLTDLDGSIQDSKDRKLTLTLEIETAMPIYNPRSVVDSTKRITAGGGTIASGGNKVKIDTLR